MRPSMRRSGRPNTVPECGDFPSRTESGGAVPAAGDDGAAVTDADAGDVVPAAGAGDDAAVVVAAAGHETGSQ